MIRPTVSKKRAAVFDLDGTLIDSMPFVVETFIYAVEPFRSRPSTEEVLSNLGGPLDTCLRNLLGPVAADSFPAVIQSVPRASTLNVSNSTSFNSGVVCGLKMVKRTPSNRANPPLRVPTQR